MLLSYSIRNAKNAAVDVEFVFFLKGAAVKSLAPEFQDKDGSLIAIRRIIPGSDDESALIEATIPTSALGTSQRKLKGCGPEAQLSRGSWAPEA